MAKTAGTEINVVLSLKFERVCGHKGYSYDATQTNERWKNWKNNRSGANLHRYQANDAYSQLDSQYSRARVPFEVMTEIGFDDCDYISLEETAMSWFERELPPIPIELHVPCRNPIDHLLSMCNFYGREFSCLSMSNESIDRQIESCNVFLDRFDYNLSQLPRASLRCFKPIPIEPYVEYMSRFLQRKRFEATLSHRDTNNPRIKSNECLWHNATLMNHVKERMKLRYQYYDFCESCIGSSSELLFME